MKKRILIVCTTDSMIWNFLIPHIKELENKGNIVECACSRTGVYYDELEKEVGLRLWELPFHRNPYSFDNIKSIYQLVRVIKNRKINVIYCHEPVGGAIGRIAGYKTNIKVIYMAHGFHFYNGSPKSSWIMYYSAEKFLSRFTDVLLTINKEDFKITENFYSKKKLLINGIGINTNKFKKYETDYIREKFNLKEESFILLTVGELILRKNHTTLIKSLASLNDKNIHLFIAGEGELRKELLQLTNALKLEKQVHFLGFCRNIPDLCNSCDVFVLPSIHEGLSMALMEAMACGKPIIASKIRGNVDLINNCSGILVETMDINGYVQSIRRLKSDKMECVEFGKNNLERIKLFDIEYVLKQLENVYENL